MLVKFLRGVIFDNPGLIGKKSLIVYLCKLDQLQKLDQIQKLDQLLETGSTAILQIITAMRKSSNPRGERSVSKVLSLQKL